MSLSLYGLISDAESTFIIDGVNHDCRSDGRTCHDFRKVEIEQDVIETTNGSARVRIGATEILVGVKAELEKPDLSTPDEGKLEFNVDCSPNATPMFEGRRGGEHIEAELGGLFDSFYKKESICDRKKLCVVKGQWCWALYVDILVLELGGNLIDVCGIGIYAALKNTTLPRLEIERGDNDEVEIQLTDDPLDGAEIESLSPVLTITIAKLGNRYIIDPSDEEEAVSKVKLSVAMHRGEVAGMTKLGVGSLDPDSVTEIVLIAKKAGKVLQRAIDQFIKSDIDEEEHEARFLEMNVEQTEATCTTAAKMICYQARLDSFSDAWPLKSPTPAQLAAAGFYYTGNEDEVMSPFMMKTISGWEEEDDPMVEASKRKTKNAYLSRKWAPKDCLTKKTVDMTLNEWYRMSALFTESKMTYVVQEITDQLENDLVAKQTQIDNEDEVDQLNVRMASYTKRARALLNQRQKKLTEFKATNRRRFAGHEPKTVNSAEQWMNGRWEMRMGHIWDQNHQSSRNQLPVPVSAKSRQSLMIQTSTCTGQQGPPSAQKPANGARGQPTLSMQSIAE